MDARNGTLSPLATLGTDYSKIRRQSSESGASDGRMAMEPVNRQTVEKMEMPEVARNVRMMFESGNIPVLHEIQKTVATFDEPTDSGVFENQPIEIEGVIRSGGYVNDVEEVRQQGATKNLLTHWKDKGKEEFRLEREPVKLAEDEGKVLENEPIRRDDVIREEDTDYTHGLPEKGTARVLTDHWISRKDEFQKEQKPIDIYENVNEPAILENEPEVRTDVHREEDNEEEIWLRKGFARDLAGYWAGPKGEFKGRDGPIDLGQETDGVIAENDPIRLEGVVRGDDPLEEYLPIEQGRARTMVTKWQTAPEATGKQPFRLEVDQNEAGVYENQPMQLQEGVIKCMAQVDDVVGQKGMIKNITERYLQKEEDNWKPPEMIVIDKADGPSILENTPEPVRADVVSGDYTGLEEHQVEKGSTKTLVQRWKNQDVETVWPKGQRSRVNEDPTWILEAEKAVDHGVFENEPQVRTDVIREEYQPEMISVAQTRSTREMWSKMGQDDGRKGGRPQQCVRFTPPRELTPPRFHQEDFKSYQSITLSSDSTLPACGPSPNSTQQQRSSIQSPGGTSYGMNQPSSDQPKTSSAVLVLKSN